MMMQDIRQGSVIKIRLDNCEKGRGVERPAVVLSIVGNKIDLVVCTAHPNPKERVVEISSPSIKLSQRTWAVINWRGEYHLGDVIENNGGFLRKTFGKIITAIKEAEANSEPFSLDFVEWFNLVQHLESISKIN